MKTPDGILNDGAISPTESYIQELKSYIAANGMNAKKVIFAVSSTKIASREATIPMVKENKVAEMLMSNITDYFPVDPSSYQFAHNIMDTVTDEAGTKQYRVMIMACPSEILEGYSYLAQQLGLELSSIDYSGNSIFQALRHRFATGVNLTVKIDERSSLLTVTNNGVITMQRSGIYGADQVVDIMMDTDVYGEPLSYEAAVKTLRRNNLVMKADEEATLADKEAEVAELERQNEAAIAAAAATGDNSQVASATVKAKQAGANLKMLRLRRDVTYAYEQLISSIVRVIDYYNSKNRDAAIDNIIITGIAADFWGFAGLLSDELGREVEVLKDLAGTNINQGLHLQDVSLGDYISVIGAGLGSVGFMPASMASEKGGKGKGAKKSSASNEKLPVIVFVAGLAISVALVALSVPKYFTTKIEGDNLAEKKTQLEPVQDIYDTYVQTKANCDYLNAVYAQTDNYNRDLYDVITELEQKLPKDVEVITLNVTTTGVSLNFSVANKEEAAASIINLRSFDCFSDVVVTTITEVTDEDTGTSHVEVTADCTYGTNPALLEETDDNADSADAEATAE
jgi:type IV pilus assembly protein PilN